MSENERYYKRKIVENMVQVARLMQMGFFVDENGIKNIVSYNDREIYANGYYHEALNNATQLVMERMSSIDCEVD